MFNIWTINYSAWWGFTFNNINTFSYSSVSYSVATQESSPQGIEFNTDGTKMFIIWFSWDDINEYTLSTWFDLSSTVTFIDSFSISGQDTTPQDIKFNSDGTKLFMLWRANGDVFSYTLSTWFDISTASYDSASYSVSEGSNLYGLTLNEDGTKMIILSSWNSTLYSYTLSTGWDITSASYDSVSYTMSWIIWSLLRGMCFTPDGSNFLISGVNADTIYQFSNTTWFDISTASYDSLFLSVSAQDWNPQNMRYNSTWDKLFLVWSTWDKVYEYSI